MRLAFALLALCLLAPDIHAGESEAAEARQHFVAGTKLYADGKLTEALAEFEKANQLKPDPALLYDLAQTHRALGHPSAALTFYKAFLEAAPYAPNREEVSNKIHALEEEVARVEVEHRKVESTVAAATKRAQEAEEAKRVAQDLAAVAAAQTMRAEEAQRSAHEAELRAEKILATGKPPPLYKRWWLWTIVGGVAAAGVITGSVLGSANHTPSTSQGSFAF